MTPLRVAIVGCGLIGRKRADALGDDQVVGCYDVVREKAFAAKWEASGCPGAMAVMRNAGRWERSNARYARGRVLRYDKFFPTDDMAWIDYGLGGLDAKAVGLLPEIVSDFASLHTFLTGRGELFGFPATRRFYDIGTPEGFRKTDCFLSTMCDG